MTKSQPDGNPTTRLIRRRNLDGSVQVIEMQLGKLVNGCAAQLWDYKCNMHYIKTGKRIPVEDRPLFAKKLV